MLQAFNATKQALADATMPAHPQHGAPIALSMDASDTAVGGVLKQFVSDTWQPLAFFSRMLRPPETKYSAFDHELLAVYLDICHFRFFLEGRPFTIFTDHKPLTFAMARMADPWSAQQQHHWAYISEFSTDIQHVAGKNNAVADALSRTVQAIGAEGIDYAAMAINQQSDNDLQNLRSTSTGLRLKKILFDSATTIWCDVSTGTPHSVVPPDWRRSVFDVAHNLSHPGIQTTCTMVANKFMWRNMNKQSHRVGQVVHSLPAIEDRSPRARPAAMFRGAATPFRLHPRRSCWTTATVSGFFVPALHHGQVHTVARSHPSHGHLGQVLRLGAAVSLGCTFWPSDGYLFG